MTVPRIPLNDGATIPQLGLGVYKVPAAETERIVSEALELGYRHIDTASLYGNEEGVGAAIAGSGIPRDELFVTTKLWNSDQGAERAAEAIERSLGRLGLERVDLYLIHWPVPSRGLFVETWRALERMKAAGMATSIGVSNFRVEDLELLARETDTIPAVNQIELHPLLAQAGLRAYHAAHGIVTEAWGPLGHGHVDFFGEPAIADAAAAHGVTPAQAVLRWHVQHGIVVFPKSTHRERIAQNIDVFGFELTADEMAAIDALDRGRRLGGDPAEVGA